MLRHRSLRDYLVLSLPTLQHHQTLRTVERSLRGHHPPPPAVLLVSIHTRIHVVTLGHGTPLHCGHAGPVELRQHAKLRGLDYHELVIVLNPLAVPLLKQIPVQVIVDLTEVTP
jgi:hypothetical protein